MGSSKSKPKMFAVLTLLCVIPAALGAPQLDLSFGTESNDQPTNQFGFGTEPKDNPTSQFGFGTDPQDKPTNQFSFNSAPPKNDFSGFGSIVSVPAPASSAFGQPKSGNNFQQLDNSHDSQAERAKNIRKIFGCYS